MSASNQTKASLVQPDLMNRGFAACIRNKEYYELTVKVFEFLRDRFNDMRNEKKQDFRTLFEHFFELKNAVYNWEKISLLYQSGKAPIKIKVPEGFNQEEEETEQLKVAMNVVFTNMPENDKKEWDLFVKNFERRAATEVDNDFNNFREVLEVISIGMARQPTPAENALKKTNIKKMIEVQEATLHRVKSIFAASAGEMVCSDSEQIFKLIADPSRTRRIPFYAGDDVMSMDGQLNGWPSVGLTIMLGASSTGKTLCMSSLIANHCKMALVNPEAAAPPVVWGYAAEDGIEEYTRRVLSNVLNSLSDTYYQNQFDKFGLSELNERIDADERFRTLAFQTVKKVMSNLYWQKSPESPEAKMSFSVMNLLNLWDARLAAGQAKPKFIIIDYLNLLHLPSNGKSKTMTRADEVSMIAHFLDEWGARHGIAIFTAVQASITGVVGTRDMRHLEQEDIHECKSVFNHSRMFMSLLAYKEIDDMGQSKDFMSIKILKNRAGQRGQVFISDLDYRMNITFSNTKHYDEDAWEAYKENLIAKRKDLREASVKGITLKDVQKMKDDNKNRKDKKTPGQSSRPEKTEPLPMGDPVIEVMNFSEEI